MPEFEVRQPAAVRGVRRDALVARTKFETRNVCRMSILNDVGYEQIQGERT